MGKDKMEIQETTVTTHTILMVDTPHKDLLESVDVHRMADSGELLSVSVGSLEISPEVWELLLFLKEEGKL